MIGRREEIKKWLSEIIEKFRQRGALSPDRAMTAEELGLPPGFQGAMKRRLGRSGIFIEVDGKYYLNEARLKEIEEQRNRERAAWGSRSRVLTLRIVRMVVAILSVALLLVNIFIQRWELRAMAAIFLVVLLTITILQFDYLSRVRRRLRGLEISSIYVR